MNILKQYMAKNNYTQEEAAKEMGVSPTTVAKWMNDVMIPYDRNRYKIQEWSKGEIPMDYWDNKEMGL